MSTPSPIGARIHAVFNWSLYGLVTGLLGVFIALGALRSDPHRRFGLWSLRLFWGRLLWWSNPTLRVTVLGTENMGEGPYILVSNHQSVLDIPLLYRLPLPLTVAARPGLFHVKVMGPFLRLSGQINTANFFTEGSAAIGAGLSVAVFAEGGRATEHGLQRFRSGAFELAEQVSRPILPVVLDGTRFVLVRGGFLPTRRIAHITLRVLPPIPCGPDAKRQTIDAMRPVLAELQAGT